MTKAKTRKEISKSKFKMVSTKEGIIIGNINKIVIGGNSKKTILDLQRGYNMR